jgi:hypothetical protein
VKKYYDYLLIYLLIAFSVVPFFAENKLLLVFITLAAFGYLLTKKQPTTISRSFSQILFLLAVMYCGQILTLGMGSIDFESIFGTYIRFGFPFIVLKTVRSSFIEKFVKINYFFALVVLVFWIIERITPGFSTLVQQISQTLALDPESNENIIIYNSEPHFGPFGLKKNAGFAYEGGAYSIILFLALFLNYLQTKSMKNKESFVLILTLLSTFSTSAYLSLILFLIASLFVKYNKNYLALFFSTLIGLTSCYYIYTKLPFLKVKIESQLDMAQSDVYATAGRFASAQADLIELQRNPIFGVGKFEKTRFKTFSAESEQHRANGLADFLAKFGILFFVGYYGILFDSIRNFILLHGINSHLFITVVFIILFLQPFSQTANQWPVYMCLIYLARINVKTITMS